MFDDLQLTSGACLVAVSLFAQYVFDTLKIKKNSKLLLYSSLVVLGQVLKMVYYDIPSMDTNFYWYFGVDKDADYSSSIKRAYRELALNLHPDQNASPDAAEQFNLLSFMNEVLGDTGKRDIYNRFGVYVRPNPDNSGNDTPLRIIDPRADEFDLIMRIAVVYLFWGLVTFLWTLPPAYRAARSWVGIILGIAAVCECLFALSQTNIPAWLPVPGYLTEHELVVMMHLCIPAVLLLCSAMSEYCYRDPNEVIVQVISDLIKQQKINQDMISYLNDLLRLNAAVGSATQQSQSQSVGAAGAKNPGEGQDQDQDQAAAAAAAAELLLLTQQTRGNVGKVMEHLEAQKQELLRLNTSILLSLEEYKLRLIGNKNDPLAKIYWYVIIAVLLGAQYLQQ